MKVSILFCGRYDTSHEAAERAREMGADFWEIEPFIDTDGEIRYHMKAYSLK